MATTRQKGAILLMRDRLQLYIPGMRSVIEFRFVPEIVRDLDVYNREMFNNLVKMFIANAKLPPSNLVIAITDSAAIIKDFTSTPPPQQQNSSSNQSQVKPSVPLSMGELEKQEDEFLSVVPFEEVISKSFPIKNGIRVYAINKDLYETLRGAFESQGFSIVAILPAVAFGSQVGAKTLLDAPTALDIIRRSESLKQFNLINQPVFTLEPEEAIEEQPVTQRKPSLIKKYQIPLAIGIFVILIALLVVLVIQQIQPPSKPKPQTPVNQNAGIPVQPKTITAVPTEIQSASPEAALASEEKQMTVQIIASSGSSAAGQTLRQQLSSYSFKSVTLTPQSSIGSSGTLITYSSSVSQNVRDIITAEVKKISPNPIIQEKSGTEFAVSIILVQ